MKTRSAGWIGGTVVLIVAIFAATWFLLASPRFEAAAATRSEAENAQQQNEILQIQVDALRAESLLLADYRRDLAQIAIELPPEARLADLTHTVAQLALDNGVVVGSITPGSPAVVTLPIPAVVTEPAADPAADPDSTAIETAEETADDAEAAADAQDDTQPQEPAAPTAPAQIDGFVAVPIAIVVGGAYENVLAYLDALQHSERLFLVAQLEAVRLEATEAVPGAPAGEGEPPADGEPAADQLVTLTITGMVYVLVDQPGSTGTSGEVSAEDETPTTPPVLPDSDRNPFIPLAPVAAEDQPPADVEDEAPADAGG
jgi:hypothetical protein